MIIIMLGAQGTGKGTVAGLISEKTKWPQISTGDIFRKNISEKTELGIEADKYISQGNLVPDEITVPMVANRLKQEDAKDGAILDGFPRTIEQAEKLDEILSGLGKKVDLVINLVTPKEEIIDSLENWIELREVRNELEHDYPEELEEALVDLKFCIDSFEKIESYYLNSLKFANKYLK